MDAGDVDPAVACLEYIANRFELNLSQRYWLAFLYGTNYCAPTTFLIYNEFPDFEMVDTARLQRWWTANKSKLLFQTDRLRIKTMDGFVPAFNSYRKAVAGNQWSYFKKAGDWKQCYRKIEAIRNFGRFSTFNYMDVLNRITDTTHAPTYLNMAEAESCRKGLCYAIGKDDWVEEPLTKARAEYLHAAFLETLRTHRGNIYQVETTLCAYKKYRWGKRYVGYYIERMRKEILKLQQDNPHGVAWEVLWQFRAETYRPEFLHESI